MQVTVKAKDFTRLFKDFIKNGKVMVNFKVNGNKMDIQILGDYTVCYSVDVSVIHTDSYNEISAWVDKTINILTDDLDITLTIAETVINIAQGAFYTTLLREYEERREFVDTSNLELKNAYANRLKYLTHCVVSCMGLAKELNFSDPDPVFSHGRFYADYQQTYFVEHMDFPECCLTLAMMRDFIFKLDEKAMYAYLSEYNLLYFKSKIYEFWVPTVNHNIDGSTITAIDKKIAELVPVTKISLQSYAERIQVLTSVFPKKKFTLSLGEGNFNISITSNTTFASVGDNIEKYILSKHLTSAQLDTALKLFKDDEEIEILRGGNCICLRAGEKNMLIAGLTF